MESYRNFQLAAYVWAYYLRDATREQMEADIDTFRQYAPLDKVYLENHRAQADVPVEKLRVAKEVFESRGIRVSGGITSTALVNGKRKPSIFGTFCYTDEEHRALYVRLIEDLASVFDEIILDDFFFTACKCEKCIAAKGKKSWAEYRLGLMEEFSHVIVDRAKAVNPRMNFIIKYPAWYKSYHETGYNPEKQRDIFDMIYTGTETREAVYNGQHLQRYHSYAIMRFLENAAPGKNGGGWIDAGGSDDNINRFLEQAELTVLAGAKELTLWNFTAMIDPKTQVLPAMGKDLRRIDAVLDRTGKPVGVPVYEPFNSDGEDLLYNYLGMGGIAFEPTQEFPKDAPAVFVTRSSAKDPEIVEKIEEYVRKGGNLVMTSGFLKETWDRGIRDMTSVRITDRTVEGREYMISNRNYTKGDIVGGADYARFDVLEIKDNATNADVSVCCREFNTPVVTEEDYGAGRLFVLNVPHNFADFYRLPQKVWEAMAKHLSMGQRVYCASDEKCIFVSWDNNVIGIQNYATHTSHVSVVIRGGCRGLRDLESGDELTPPRLLARPDRGFDTAFFIPEPEEYVVDLQVGAGSWRFFEVM